MQTWLLFKVEKNLWLERKNWEALQTKLKNRLKEKDETNKTLGNQLTRAKETVALLEKTRVVMENQVTVAVRRAIEAEKNSSEIKKKYSDALKEVCF